MADKIHRTSLLTGEDILRATPDLYLILDTQFYILDVSNAYLKATMVRREDIIGRNVFEVFPDNPNDPKANGSKNLRASLEKVLKNKKPHTMSIQKYDIRKPKEEGGEFEVRYWSPINTPILDKNNKVSCIIHRVEDITDYIYIQKARKNLQSHLNQMEVEIYNRSVEIHETNKQLEEANAELKHLVYFDGLTGLANRKYLSQQVEVLLNSSTENKLAFLFLDLDKLKQVNDTLGHKVGDQLLQVVAKRLKGQVQSTDIISRLSGDEFVIVLKNIKDKYDIEKIANRILRKIADPIAIDQHRLHISASIGISVFPDDAHDEITLLKHADIAMYQAKQKANGSYQFCTTQMIHDVHQKVIVENNLRTALVNQQFEIYYQPQMDLKTGKISGLEALLRLKDQHGSIVLPSHFLSVAEESGLIVPIGDWVIKTACEQFKIWEEKFPHFNNIKLGINLSPRQIQEANFVQRIKSILDNLSFQYSNLEFEITETPILKNIENSTQILKQLKKLGIKIALDDFGIGYSSLKYLRQFNIDTLKIDPSLMKNVPLDEVSTEILLSIMKMAHVMNIDVIVEGVENEDQILFLKNHHCDKIQSYFVSHPLKTDEVAGFLNRFILAAGANFS